MRTIPDITDLLQPLEDVIHQSFIPALFGRPSCSSTERDLYALPVRLGGLGLMNPCSAASSFRGSCSPCTQNNPLEKTIVITRHYLEIQCIVSSPPLLNTVLTMLGNLGHPLGLLSCRYKNMAMAFICTRVISEMLYLSLHYA